MADKAYPPPIQVAECDGRIRVSYDRVKVDFPSDGPAPEGAPRLACRIFEAMRDLRGEVHAE